MFWIKHFQYETAGKELRRIYDRVKGPSNNVDNILMAHSLRPHTLLGHMALYKSVLHHRSNSLPKWYLETLGVYVSLLNACDYCVTHHFEGLKRLLNDDTKSNDLILSLKSSNLSNFFSAKEGAGLDYAKMLTLHPGKVKEKQIQKMKNEGFTDGEILEINQVTSYFNYANRTVLGLGVHSDGDLLGLSPSDSDQQNWSHK